MRVIIFVLTLVATTWAVAVPPVSGTILKTSSGIYLQSNDSCSKYRIETKSDDALSTLTKLSNGDAVTATGLFDTDNCVTVIETVDYVGLRRLLGSWMSRQGLITVHDFSSMSFYPTTGMKIKDHSESDSAYTVIKPVQYKYSVTPSNGNEWVVFLSDAESTTFTTIQFSRENAVLKVYDSDTGNVTNVLLLSRRGNLK